MDAATALPVEVAVDRRLHDALVAHLEGPLGWQVTVGGDLPPVLRLAGVGAEAAARAGEATPRRVPTVLLVREDDPAAAVASAARAADAVLAWPDERDQLPALAGTLVGPSSQDARGAAQLVVGGAAGGVGTTTIALAVGGLVAWHGRRCLVVCTGDVPVPDVPTVAPGALAGHRVWDAAVAVPGAPGLRAVAAPAGPRADVAVPSEVAVVRDDGVAADADVLVVARDRAGLDAVARTVAGVVVVADRGPVAMSALRRQAAGRRCLAVAWSVRVARAGVTRRVPTSLPGRWLAELDPLARALA